VEPHTECSVVAPALAAKSAQISNLAMELREARKGRSSIAAWERPAAPLRLDGQHPSTLKLSRLRAAQRGVVLPPHTIYEHVADAEAFCKSACAPRFATVSGTSGQAQNLGLDSFACAPLTTTAWCIFNDSRYPL
jgi:hypothetical protein